MISRQSIQCSLCYQELKMFAVSNYGIFVIFVLSIFLKNILFNLYVYHGLILSSFITNPPAFWSFWLPKIAIAIGIASISLFFKNKKWILILLLALDIWIEANLVYFRCNHLFIDYYALTMAGNMEGLWDSIVVFIHAKDLAFIGLTLLVGVLLWYAPNANRSHWKSALICVCLSISMQVMGNYCHHLAVPEMPFVPFQITQSQRFKAWCHEVIPVKENSVFHVPLWDVVDFFTLGKESYIMSQDDINMTNPFIQLKQILSPSKKCLIIVVESMESWVVHPEIMPNLYTFIQAPHTLYCPHVKSQIRQGISSDGQLIVNTGLLPIQRGAWSFLYPDNEYPSITSLYQGNSVSLDPSDGKLWNKHNYLQAWRIGEDIQTEEADSLLFNQVLTRVKVDCPCVWTITMSTHAPFEYYTLNAEEKNDMPSLMKHYTYSFSMLDKALGLLLDSLQQGDYLKDRVLLITGDHTILSPDNRDDFRQYCKNANINYSNIDEYVPLLIYSSNIDNVKMTETVYQMDIYPTILSLIGCEDYWWKGFGVNLLDSVAIKNRPITEEDAYDLSDKIIRSNYFKSLFSK